MKIPGRTGVTAGVTADLSHSRAPDGRAARRRRRAVVAGLVAAGLAGSGLVLPGVAAAAVPAFPDNIVVFPDRDFVSVEGYEDHAGEKGTIEVRRGGTLIGSAQATVEAGGVAFEINHPGGTCWGVGAPANLQVTPDIKPGDVVSLTLESGGPAGETTVGNAFVTQDMQLNGATLTVTGFIAPGMNPDFFEQRIIAPDLKDTTIGRRDIRALNGPLTPAPKGGYQSGVTVTGTQFVATYVFDDPANALIASKADLGERAMTWQVQDADGNRQGLTIAEFGEAGGPGMGGCPAGPAASGPPVGTAGFTLSPDKTSMVVNWTAPDPVPNADPVTGYEVTLLGPPDAGGLRRTLGARTGATARTVTVPGLSATTAYTVEVRSIAGTKIGEPFTVGNGGTSGPEDQTAPVVTVAPAGGADAATAVVASSVTLTSSEPSDIYFTTDGSPAISTDLPADNATRYTGPIPVTALTELHWAAFDAASNHDSGAGFYKPGVATPPTIAPTNLVGTGGQLQATLRWASADTTATGYDVQLYTAAGATVGAVRPAVDKTLTVTGLVVGSYQFTVAARNGAGVGPVSPKSAVFTVTRVQDTISVTQSDFKARDVRVRGTTSAAVGSTVNLRTGSATGPIIATATVTAPAVAGGNGEFDLRNRTLTTNPSPVFVTTPNGATGPITLTPR